MSCKICKTVIQDEKEFTLVKKVVIALMKPVKKKKK